MYVQHAKCEIKAAREYIIRDTQKTLKLLRSIWNLKIIITSSINPFPTYGLSERQRRRWRQRGGTYHIIISILSLFFLVVENSSFGFAFSSNFLFFFCFYSSFFFIPILIFSCSHLSRIIISLHLFLGIE